MYALSRKWYNPITNCQTIFFLNMIGTVDNGCGGGGFKEKKINTKRVEDRATTA